MGFLNPVPVDPLVHLDAEPNTGLVIRGSKGLMATMRLAPSQLFPDVGDILIPLFVHHEHAEGGLSTRKTIKGLQGSCSASGAWLRANLIRRRRSRRRRRRGRKFLSEAVRRDDSSKLLCL